MRSARQLKELYRKGENISALLREAEGVEHNSQETIEVAYDLQSGSYVAAMEKDCLRSHQRDYGQAISSLIGSLCKPKTILEAGVGEATTFADVVQQFQFDVTCYGFDISWSRAAVARQWLKREGVEGTVLCTGDLLSIPFATNSIDVVYTSHSIEPNGGSEEPILRELYRVAKKYLVLLEPGREFASADAQRRMDSHGYCKGLNELAIRLGYDVLEHKLFPVCANPLNPTAVTVIKKVAPAEAIPDWTLACPRYKTKLEQMESAYFSPEALVAYPVIGGIPCLRIENGVLASKFEDVFGH